MNQIPKKIAFQKTKNLNNFKIFYKFFNYIHSDIQEYKILLENSGKTLSNHTF